MPSTKKEEKGKRLTVEDTRSIAKLARINLTNEDEKKFTSQLNNILAYFQQLSEVDTESVVPQTHPTDMVNNFREDKVRPSLKREEALKNAPNKKDGFFVAPRIVSDN